MGEVTTKELHTRWAKEKKNEIKYQDVFLREEDERRENGGCCQLYMSRRSGLLGFFFPLINQALSGGVTPGRGWAGVGVAAWVMNPLLQPH